MNLKKIGAVISVLMLAAAFGMKIIGGEPAVPWISIVVMLLFLIVLICEVLPVTLVCILMLGFMPVLGVTKDFNTALVGFSNQVVFFIFASFGIATALMKVPLSKRILKFLLLKFGKNSKLFVLSFMICTSLVSTVISNVPTCAVFIAIILEMLNLMPEDEKKQTGKTFMIGIPIASMIGGVVTPAGSSINLLAINLLQGSTDYDVTFIEWMLFGLPLAAIILPFAWFILVKVFPPADIKKENIDKFINDLKVPEKIIPEEKRAIIIFSTIFILWLSSSWIRSINIMVVSLIGCGVICMPKIGMLSVKEFINKVSWDSFFLVGTVLSLGSALVKNGVIDKAIQFLPSFGGSQVLVLACVALCSFIFLVFIPVAPSFVTIFAPIVIHIALNANINPALTIMICAMCAGNAYLLPLDTVALLSFGHGYYKMFEMSKVTYIVQIAMVVVMSVLFTVIGKLVFS